MDKHVRARRLAIARNELQQSTRILAERFGIAASGEDIFSRVARGTANDPELETLHEIETAASVVKRVAEATGGFNIAIPQGHTERPGRTEPRSPEDTEVARQAAEASQAGSPPTINQPGQGPTEHAAADQQDQDWTQVKGIGAATAEALADAGYTTLAHIKAAPDAELMEVAGINKKNLAALREYAGQPPAE